MRYSIEPRDRIYVKGYELLSFAETIGKNIDKNISSKYSQKLVDTEKKSATDEKKCFKKGNSKNSRSNMRFNW